ncbi:MAG: peroxiredoxin [Pseudomonadota bacterium]
MALSTGDTLPEATFNIMTADGPGTTTTSEVFGGKKVVAFAVPGAFTPTCSLNHLPGFIENAASFKEKGVDAIVCISVNDPFVMGAWEKSSGADGAIHFLGDANASFTKAAGMDFTVDAVGLVSRSQRYAMMVEDKVVKTINIEDSPGEAEASSAANLLKAL